MTDNYDLNRIASALERIANAMERSPASHDLSFYDLVESIVDHLRALDESGIYVYDRTGSIK